MSVCKHRIKVMIPVSVHDDVWNVNYGDLLTLESMPGKPYLVKRQHIAWSLSGNCSVVEADRYTFVDRLLDKFRGQERTSKFIGKYRAYVSERN